MLSVWIGLILNMYRCRPGGLFGVRLALASTYSLVRVYQRSFLESEEAATLLVGIPKPHPAW